ncbi:MAG TPA: SRPBCC family protein [Pirellulaceae bacterium]|nr:SRPBCC family protein [Pirellulaceae bacterium]HMO91108.1 SRPBCC family protein [Pirellulaceae bacterium]HMP70545.1 SRPBCC family protein [Pirellulaceae bacterium]
MPAFSVAKNIVVNASADKVFATVADFGTWTSWSPWLIAEPEAKVVVSSNPSSIGSTYAWEGDVTGQGIIKHVKLEPGQLIEEELEFIKPFKSRAKIAFEFRPSSSGTEVIWTMESSLPWFLFWMIPMMKTFIGMDYRRGLNMLKDYIETGSIPSKTIVHGVEAISPLRMAGLAGACHVDNVGETLHTKYVEVERIFNRLGISTEGGMIAVYTRFQVKQQVFQYICGYVIPANENVPLDCGLTTWSLPACKAFRVEHIGSYRHLGNGWSVANQIARYRKLKQQRIGTFELYRTTPPTTPEAELATDIYLPLK